MLDKVMRFLGRTLGHLVMIPTYCKIRRKRNLLKRYEKARDELLKEAQK